MHQNTQLNNHLTYFKNYFYMTLNKESLQNKL